MHSMLCHLTRRILGIARRKLQNESKTSMQLCQSISDWMIILTILKD